MNKINFSSLTKYCFCFHALLLYRLVFRSTRSYA
ncbi:hypothetical protein BVRB_4g083610 [Beta vulgaris subsp. vulgaris]|nr:hypothetical protein BVRB_4g083610 [Beta vulgaris subsp. vulgaris]